MPGVMYPTLSPTENALLQAAATILAARTADKVASEVNQAVYNRAVEDAMRLEDIVRDRVRGRAARPAPASEEGEG
ncbi:MAG: hypothetical protein QOD06_3034 [Candidatus Binatota bacterium]|nr:hypothetical protein [Candidatus Binatota bacterium]